MTLTSSATRIHGSQIIEVWAPRVGMVGREGREVDGRAADDPRHVVGESGGAVGASNAWASGP